MKSPMHLLGYDFGASNGRAMHGTFDGKKLELTEIHRFPNEPVLIGGTLYWDILRLFHETKTGLAKMVRSGYIPKTIGIDTWGVDFGLLDQEGKLLANPVHYRDHRTDGMMEYAQTILPKEKMFEYTGLAFMQFNTVYQLLALVKQSDTAFSHAKKLLFIPDLIAYFLTGVMGTEYTIASTSQLMNPRTRSWSREVFDSFGLSESLMSPLQEPGMIRGFVTDAIAEECNMVQKPQVVASAGHDTAAAVAAVPASGKRFAYISSGTWSLLGTETDSPVISTPVMDANYTNEGGICGKTRVLKNIMGMWIIQECRRQWLKEGECEDYAGIAAAAGKAPELVSFIDPDDNRFLAPGDMPELIRGYCRETKQHVPETRGEIARCVYESLAMKYRWAVKRLEHDVLNERIDTLHIVGGGSNNNLLNQMTANAIGRNVVAGPGEATVIGNLLVQAMALGELSGLSDIREVVRASFETKEFIPCDCERWDDAYGRFLNATGLKE